uniref:Putative ixodes 10 kDa peptide protein n=1 Tax=Ixodes ricinus TaxID=34613 RepID=A0A0K8R3L3_IXORI
MHRNIRNMLFVLFAVVLILPAFQGEGFSSGIQSPFHCWDFARSTLTLFCKSKGSKDYGVFHPYVCHVTCIEPPQRLLLPRHICSSGGLQCGEAATTKLNILKKELEEKKSILLWMIGAVVNTGSNFCYGNCDK